MSKKLIVLFLFTVFAFTVFANKRKDPLNVQVQLNYSLPRIAIDLDVVLERKVFKQGPFAQYAEKFLGIDSEDVVNRDREEWTLLSVNMDSHSQVDPKHKYSINLTKDYKTMMLRLSPNGFITGFNTAKDLNEVENKATVISAINAKEGRNIEYGTFSVDRPYFMVEDTNRVVKNSKISKGANLIAFNFEGKTLEDKAKEAAHIIFKLRKRRFKILTANFDNLPTGETSYKVIVEELKELENRYMELFVGKEYSEKINKTYVVIPQENSKSQVVMRYSPQKGFVDKTDVTGIPLVLEYTNIVKEKGIAVNSPQSDATINLRYRLPAQVNIVLKSGKKVIGNKQMLIPQLGSVASLSLTVVAEENLSVEFYPGLGSIKNIYKSQR